MEIIILLMGGELEVLENLKIIILKCKVECWKTDYKAKRIYEKEISGVKFKIFPAFHIKYFGDYSRSLISLHLKRELSKRSEDHYPYFKFPAFIILLFSI